MRLSKAEARELKDLVEAETDRQFVAIKNKLDHYWTVVVGYDGEQAWSELRELVSDLVKSNLASLDKSLAIVLAAPPVKAPVVEAPKEPEPELEPVEPAVEPAAEPAAEAEVTAAEPEKPEPEPGSKGSRT
ncbi:unnamed protein product [marine sediment metagenome]|uniref:Uncharacterized protein n=1 Tax=marine sediment metagenome TaxID=412755 RepID=X1TAA1_9ZZZZ